MSRIKQEIDRAIEHYGDQATVFRVVRRATRKVKMRLNSDSLFLAMLFDDRRFITRKVQRYCRSIRRLLPIERPVTTERLVDAYDYSEGNAILRKELNERPEAFMKALKEWITDETSNGG